ncbi:MULTISPECIES: hypothetical protein [Acidiplasma]|jgi:hypothetical protein|uniref:Apea-like HEPN domain-containing protein n=2 Tax=Acidiplasma TaxID=507753 RepID=A0A0N8VLC9_9ARCH|nr:MULTISPECIES: hypothetical protein [Acidiplasma]KJE49835.1 hypothetical protein TZ01_01720 [Acidiplasma sp. MBA-1]KPV46812.1 hypothetical protein SE19_03940 [Acidiplasma aeolicum]KQB35823.1 hypothetical protein AOG54_02630 [Acidiplasma aeolicum]KQB36172.1 hypothetical protein AOG55_00395 [Acidiplasma cupricumulans]WMT54996.1 MAG: hypothetical protein RE470_08790 [Acidiplasma sp.]
MDLETKNYILKNIFDFFQYSKRYDRLVLTGILNSMDYHDDYITFNKLRFKIGRNAGRDKILGFFLANLPVLIEGRRTERNDLTPKLTKLKNDTLELISLGKFNELATLDMYLLLEMGLRCAYSIWVGKKAIIERPGYDKIILYDQDYRKIKLYLRLNKIGHYDVLVNGQPFPSSQNSLLHWSEKFTDRNSDLLFRLALNIRNLLAHGENEWELYPFKESVESSSYAVGKVLDRIKL